MKTITILLITCSCLISFWSSSQTRDLKGLTEKTVREDLFKSVKGDIIGVKKVNYDSSLNQNLQQFNIIINTNIEIRNSEVLLVVFNKKGELIYVENCNCYGIPNEEWDNFTIVIPKKSSLNDFNYYLYHNWDGQLPEFKEQANKEWANSEKSNKEFNRIFNRYLSLELEIDF